jgi:hypothetical protein
VVRPGDGVFDSRPAEDFRERVRLARRDTSRKIAAVLLATSFLLFVISICWWVHVHLVFLDSAQHAGGEAGFAVLGEFIRDVILSRVAILVCAALCIQPMFHFRLAIALFCLEAGFLLFASVVL